MKRILRKKTLDELLRHNCRPGDEPALICLAGEVGESFHYWHGASGRRYLHSVFGLVDCPEISKANYILVHCDDDGVRRALAVGQTVEDANSLNLAHLRQRAARIGANEIHIHVLADAPVARDAVETDLRLRHLTRCEHGEGLARAG